MEVIHVGVQRRPLHRDATMAFPLGVRCDSYAVHHTSHEIAERDTPLEYDISQQCLAKYYLNK